MKADDIYNLIVVNGCCNIQLLDTNNNKLHEVSEGTADASVDELKKCLNSFSGYKRLRVQGRNKESTAWNKAFTWQLEFPGEVAAPVGAPVASAQAIGVMDYITMFKEMSSENMKLTRELLEQSLKVKNEDPAKWLPVLTAVAPMLGFRSPGVAGPAAASTSDLHFADVDASKLSDKELNDKINSLLTELPKKIHAAQMVKLLVALNSIPELHTHADKIAKLLDAVSKNPGILNLAMSSLNIPS